MRGADGRFSRPETLSSRFIPTCVGQIPLRPSVFSRGAGSSPRAWGRYRSNRHSGSACSVHPHVRGADERHVRIAYYELRFIPTCVGQISLPCVSINETVRFIPTCVGQMHRPCPAQLHEVGSSPRAWGRSRCLPSSSSARTGSSPRAWGRWRSIWRIKQSGRFIPTCVGQIAW